MKEKFLFTHEQLRMFLDEILEDYRQCALMNLPFDQNSILLDEDVCKILRVSRRTLHSYREKEYIRPVTLSGRHFYIKCLLFMDLLELYEAQYRKDDDGKDEDQQEPGIQNDSGSGG